MKLKIAIDWRDTVWQIARLYGNNRDTMQKGLSDYSNNERQWQKIDGINRCKGQWQQIAIPSAVHELCFFVKFRSTYGCPIVALVFNTEHTVLIFMWWKLIKKQHSWPADEIAISCHEWLFVVDMISLKDRSWKPGNFRTWEHVTDCPDDDTAGIDDQPQCDIVKKIQKKRERAKVCYLGIRSMYDDISFSKDDFNETSYRRMGIRSMYDDIEYSKL